MNNIDERINQRVKAELDKPESERLPHIEVTKELHKELNGQISYDKLRKRVSRRFQNPEIITIKAENNQPYRVENNTYFWNTNRGELSFPVSFVDQLCFEYSAKGYNMEAQEIILKHNLEPWQWDNIHRTFDLRKRGHIFSPYTWQNTPIEERPALIESKMNELLTNSGHVIYSGYNKAVNKEYRKVIEKEQRELVADKHALLELTRFFSQPERVKVPHVEVPKENIEHLFVSVADPHWGAQVDEMLHVPAFSPEILEERLSTLAKEINRIAPQNVTIGFLGDLIENFTGLSHANSWKSMARGAYGSGAIIGAYKCIRKFLESVNNVSCVLGVGGNHDRSTSSKNEDQEADIAKTIFFMLQEKYADAIEIQFDSDVLSKEVGGINYILTHGHTGIAKKPISEIVFKYGNNKMFNMLLTGHLHSRIIPKDGDSIHFRHLVCPSVFSGNLYSKQLGYSTLPGAILVHNKSNTGYPTTIDIPLL